jgi:putative membrane protein
MAKGGAMRLRTLTTALLVAMLGGCGGAGDQAAPYEAGDEAFGNVAPANGAVPTGTGATPGPATARDGSQFVELAGGADMYAIESARLAVENARHAGVRALAQSILDDRSRSAGALEGAAGAADPPIAHAPAISPYQLEALEALRAAAPAEFDRTFLGQQLDAQERTLTLLTDYAINGDVSSLRRYASEFADPVRRHLSRARDLVVEIPFENAAPGTRPEPAR